MNKELEYILSTKMTRYAVAKALGTSWDRVDEWVRGESQPGEHNQRKLTKLAKERKEIADNMELAEQQEKIKAV
jgi:hypothetical protein